MASFFIATLDMLVFILRLSYLNIENTLCFCCLKYLGCSAARTFPSWLGYVGDTTSSILICPFHSRRRGGSWAHSMLELWSKKFLRNNTAQPYRSDLSEFTQIISGKPQTKVQRLELKFYILLLVNQDSIIISYMLLAVCWDLETQLVSTCLCIFAMITHIDYRVLKCYCKYSVC